MCNNWAFLQENMTLLHMDNKGSEQIRHPCSLISAFVICSLDSRAARIHDITPRIKLLTDI